MTLQIITVAQSIAALEVAGVKIFKLNQIPDALSERDCPALIPEPRNYVTSLTVQRDSTGAPSEAKKSVFYTLNYTFFYAPIGSTRNLSRYEDMIRKAFAIIDTVINNDTITGLVDITPSESVNFGAVEDPSGAIFMGCTLQFQIWEFVN